MRIDSNAFHAVILSEAEGSIRSSGVYAY